MDTPTPNSEHDDNTRQQPMIPRVIVPFRSDGSDEERHQFDDDIFGALAGDPSSPLNPLPYPPDDVASDARGAAVDAGSLLDPWGGPDEPDPDTEPEYDSSEDPDVGEL